jgi:hypothetical protein
VVKALSDHTANNAAAHSMAAADADAHDAGGLITAITVPGCGALLTILAKASRPRPTLLCLGICWGGDHSSLALDGNSATSREWQGPILGLDELCSVLCCVDQGLDQQVMTSAPAGFSSQ